MSDSQTIAAKIPARGGGGGTPGDPAIPTPPDHREVAEDSTKCHGHREAVENGAKRLGLIAGNGRFPFLLLDAARAHGLSVVVAAIKEETDPEIDVRAAADP